MNILSFVSEYKKTCLIDYTLSETEQMGKIQDLKVDILANISCDFPQNDNLTIIFKEDTASLSSSLKKVSIIAEVFRSNIRFSETVR